jgi:26S proteasome regulatory subunit N1
MTWPIDVHSSAMMGVYLAVLTDVYVLQIIGVAALACGLIAVGSSNGTVTSAIAQTLMERNEASSADLKDPFARFLALGLGLSFLGK